MGIGDSPLFIGHCTLRSGLHGVVFRPGAGRPGHVDEHFPGQPLLLAGYLPVDLPPAGTEPLPLEHSPPAMVGETVSAVAVGVRGKNL